MTDRATLIDVAETLETYAGDLTACLSRSGFVTGKARVIMQARRDEQRRLAQEFRDLADELTGETEQ